MRKDVIRPLQLVTGRKARARFAPVGRIDELDRGLSGALHRNGRQSFRRVAERLGVAAATIRARFARLTSEGIVQVVAATNPLALGFEQARVGVKTSTPPEHVADEIAGWAEADYVVLTSGWYDVAVEVVVADRREVLDLTNRMRGLAMWKQQYNWGTGE